MSQPTAGQALLRIGEFTLSRMPEGGYACGRIWIQHSGGPFDGEGGAFNEADLEAVIRAFYVEHF